MLKTIEVVDDFHADPLTARAKALALDWQPQGEDMLGGSCWTAEAAVGWATSERLDRLLGASAHIGAISRALYSAVGRETPQRRVASLNHQGWTAFVWLCEPGDHQGGMSFYRQCSQSASITGEAAAGEWEEVAFIPARLNRLVLFRSSLPHKVGPGFGRTPKDALLSQVVLVPAAA